MKALGQLSLRPLACSTWVFGIRSALSTVANQKKLAPDVHNDKSYASTLLLPKTSFPLRSDPARCEVAFRKKTCEELYRWQWEHANGPVFVLHDGPPYANGRLHIGHALNKILKDIINRYHVLLGHRVHYVPGWDCHGLPIENKALQELGKDITSLTPSAIRSAARATALREIQTQRDEFMQLGIMADWSSERGTYRTLDHQYEMRQLRVFQRMLENGLIYNAHRPVSYSPSSRSALAEAELEYSDTHVSTSVYVAFALAPADATPPPIAALLGAGARVELLVWTTTPWTLSANMGIAVHPELTYAALRLTSAAHTVIVARDRVYALADILGPTEDLGDIRGSDLVGLAYRPLFGDATGRRAEYNVIPGSHVDATSGTGLVHCAPAHGVEDYNAFRALGLLPRSAEMLCHVDAAGKFTSDIADIVGDEVAKRLVGLAVLSEGGKETVDVLRQLTGEHGEGRLLNEDMVMHRYPYDWKTGKPIIVLATEQWFANLDAIKSEALGALENVRFYPAMSRTRLTSHVSNRSEWCISRQRVWGVPIPSLHNDASGRIVLDPRSLEHILGVLDRKGVEWWWDGPVADFVHPDLRDAGPWRKGTDTMDVWFDSGSSWSMLIGDGGLGSPVPTDVERTFLADVCVEGSDQHRGWFQSLLLTAIGASHAAGNGGSGKSPYGALITHAMVLDEKGRKMSKSLGNIISPMSIVNAVPGGNQSAYGADVLRLWAATVEYGRDMNIGPKVLAGCMEVLRRIRNCARFILGNLDVGGDWVRVQRSELGLADKYFMHELWKLEGVAREGYATYNFSKVTNALANFANLLSSLYFDITKDCLYADLKHSKSRRSVLTVLEQVLKTMTSVMAPVLPHLAEEIHYHLNGCAGDKGSGTSVFANQWDFLSSEWNDCQAEDEMHKLLHTRGVVLSLLEKARMQKDLRSSLEAEVDIIIPGDMSWDNAFVELLLREEELLKTLFIVSDASVIDEGSLGVTSPTWLYVDRLSIPGSDEDLGIRIRPAGRLKCPRCWTFTRSDREALCRRCAEVRL